MLRLGASMVVVCANGLVRQYNDAGAPVPFAEFAAPADKADGAAEGRMQQMFQDVRRLQYSYDFASTCVSSLMACVSDADCADDEECEVSDAAEALSQEALSAVRRMRRGTAEECEGEEECMVPM